jgi:SAM-dependent methyltransferase
MTGSVRRDDTGVVREEAEGSFARWLADVWDDEIEPRYAKPHWELLLEHLTLPPKPQVLVAGCSTGAIIPALMRLLPSSDQGRVIALEARGPLLAKARARVEDYDRRRVFLRGEPLRKLKFAAGVFDVVVSSLAWLDLAEPEATLIEFFRVLIPGGQVALAFPLRGTLQEIYDLFAEVTLKYEQPEVHRRLEEQMKRRHPTVDEARQMLLDLGFQGVELHSRDLEMTFRPEEEFFTSSLVRALFEGPWRQAVGDASDELFRHTREAIATYFGSEAFQVRLVVGCLTGVRPDLDLDPGSLG